MIIGKINSNNINVKNFPKQHKQIAIMHNSLNNDYISFKGKPEGKNIFQKGWDWLTGNDIQYFSDFEPKHSILDDDGFDYAVDVRNYSRKINNKKEVVKFYNYLYNEQMRTEKEKFLFKMYFGKYLVKDETQQTSQVGSSVNTRQTNQQGIQYMTPPTKSATSQNQVSNPTKNVTQQNINKVKNTFYKEQLLEEFEKLEKEDISDFVAKIKNGTREEQYDLLEIYQELSQKHDDLMKNDPSEHYKKEIREKYYEQLKKDVESEFKASGKKYNSTNLVVEAGKRLEQMAIDAGMNDYAPEVKNLGRKLYVLSKQMEQQNISFVPKTPEQFTSEGEKWKYINDSIRQISKNKASTMEALDVFEKYGERRFIDDKTSVTSLEVLATNISCYIDEILSKGIFKNIYHTKESIELTNTLLQRFIQVHSKYATNQVDSRSYPDVRSIGYMLSKYKSVGNKDTMLMMINSMKDLAVDQKEYKNLKYFFKHFEPMLYEAINENDLQDIEKVIEEFGKAVENLPDKVNA